MQRIPYYMRDMLSTRNPSDNWVKRMQTPAETKDNNGQEEDVMVHKITGRIEQMNASDFREVLRWALNDPRCDMYLRNQINRILKAVSED